MECEIMRSIAAWLLLASVQEPVPSQVTAAGSWAQVTRPGTMPRGTPSGESVDQNEEERMLLAAAIERVKCRRVIFICGYSYSMNHVFSGAIEPLEYVVPTRRSEKWNDHGTAPARGPWGCEASTNCDRY
jgi:hypothetical protein